MSDIVSNNIQEDFIEKLVLTNKEKEKLEIVYLMKWTGVCGGSKIVFEHANNLTKKGHRVIILCHDVRPNWFNLDEKVQFIQIPEEQEICESISKNADVIIAISSSYICNAIKQKIAPVIYFEQGSPKLFEGEKFEKKVMEQIDTQFSVCNNIFTVSQYAKDKIKELYGKDVAVVPNAVDSNIFYPAERKENDILHITAIGPDDWDFKGLKYIIEAVRKIEEKYNVEFTWITPREPKNIIEHTIVNPEQKTIGDVLRNTDIYVSASEYEAFSLPVLEAMTCGTAVITTDAGGNREFSIDKKTCLIINKKDTNDIVEKMELLINNKELRKEIAMNGQNISKNFSWDITCDKLEEYYKKIALYSVEK